MLHGLYWLAANFALEKPTVIVVDDIHWADDAPLRWLLYLSRRLEGLPLVLIGATRPPEQVDSDRVAGTESSRGTCKRQILVPVDVHHFG